MSDSTLGASPASMGRPDNTLESTARALSEFVIRAILLPITLFFTKPSRVKAAAESGDYHPLPSPFLLSLVTGVVVSGVTAEAIRESGHTTSFSDFLANVSSYYSGADGVRAVLFAIPYVAAVWIVSGLLSLLVGRREHAASAIFAMLSFILAALVELSALGLVIAFLWPHEARPLSDSAMGYSLVFFLMLGLVFAIKLIRLLIMLRSPNGPRWLVWTGASAASLPGLAISVFAAFIAGALFAGLMNQSFASVARGKAAFESGQYDQAIQQYDQAIEANPRDAEAFFWRARAFAEKGDQGGTQNRCDWCQLRAMADYGEAIRLNPQYADALQWRGVLYRSQRQFERALADLDLSIQVSPLDGGPYLDRCRTRAYWGHDLDAGLADCQEALRLYERDEHTPIAQSAAKLGAVADRALIELRQRNYDAAYRDYDMVARATASGLTAAEKADALAGCGVVLIQQGRRDEGIRDIQRAREQNDNAGWMFGYYEVVDDNWNLREPQAQVH